MKKSISLLCIFSFMVSLLLFNGCSEDMIVQGNELHPESLVSRVNLNEFNSKVIHNEIYNRLFSYFEQQNQPGLTGRIAQRQYFELVTDDILLIQKEGMSYFTFKIRTATENNIFYNLLVTVDVENQIAKSEIYEYLPDQEWLNNIKNPYKGYVKSYANDVINLGFTFRSQCLTGVKTS